MSSILSVITLPIKLFLASPVGIALSIGAVILIVIAVLAAALFFTIRFLCRTGNMPEALNFLCSATDVVNEVEKPTDTALCQNADFRSKNEDLCKSVDNKLYNKCVSDNRKKEINKIEEKKDKTKAIDSEVAQLKANGVFVSEDGKQCLQCTQGYTRSLAFGEDTPKACSNVSSPIKIEATPESIKAPNKNAVKRGKRALGKLCKNQYPTTNKLEAAKLKAGSLSCWSCPTGYKKIRAKRSGKECEPETGTGVFCGGPGAFAGPKKEGSINLGRACYKCPPGFSENLVITKAILAAGFQPLGALALAARRATFFERGCINRTVGTDEKPFMPASKFDPNKENKEEDISTKGETEGETEGFYSLY